MSVSGMLPTIVSSVAGGLCLSLSCHAHRRYLGRSVSIWKTLRSGFIPSQDADYRSEPQPTYTISHIGRHMSFASGMLLSGFSLFDFSFGEIGLALSGNLHPVPTTIATGGFLIGVGYQLGRGTGLGANALGQRSYRKAGLAAATAVGTACLAQSVPAMLYMDSAIAKYSLDADIVADGPSMLAFTAAGLLFLSVKGQLAQRLSLRPVAVSFASGAGIGLGTGLIGLCSSDKVLSLLGLTANADPTLILGLGVAAICNRFLDSRLAPSALPDPDRNKSSAISSVVGPGLLGVGVGLTGMMPVSSLVGLCSGATSFYLCSLSMMTGTAFVYGSRSLYAYFYPGKSPALPSS